MERLEERVLQYGIKFPDKIAIGTRKEQTTYGQLRGKILRAVKYFEKKEIKKGEKILLQAVQGSDYIAAYLALHCLDAVVIPVDRKATLDTLSNMKNQLTAGIYISDKSVDMEIEQLQYQDIFKDNGAEDVNFSQFDENDIFDILYTTGTTGQSKGVVTTRKSVYFAIQNEIEGTGLTEDDVLMIPIPLNHSFGIGKMRATLFLGGTVVLQNSITMVPDLKKSMKEFQCTCMICVPSALQMLCKLTGERVQEVIGGLRFIEAASEPFPLKLKEEIVDLLPETHILNRYGSTETPGAVYLDITAAPDKKASIGRALSRVKIQIVDENRKEIVSSKDHVGKLAIAGPMVMKGYYGAEELTNQILSEGWLYSKDLAYIDEDGYIYLVGRDDDVINTGGKKFSPLEVEEIIMKSGFVSECVMVGIADRKGVMGILPALAYVADKQEIHEYDILDYLKDKIEPYKMPAKCVRLERLPRNYMGKLERKEIKKILEEE
jgi:long-chain acyl-CoA synthetase